MLPTDENSPKRPEAATLCMQPLAASCTGTADAGETCDLDASTDGTAECPAGCNSQPGNTNPYVNWASEDVEWHGESGPSMVCASVNELEPACNAEIGMDYGGNPDYVATAASDAIPATECTGTADDGTSTCDLEASTDGTAECPAGCDNNAVGAIAVGDTVSCGFAPIVEIIADHADWPAPGWYEINSDAFSVCLLSDVSLTPKASLL